MIDSKSTLSRDLTPTEVVEQLIEISPSLGANKTKLLSLCREYKERSQKCPVSKYYRFAHYIEKYKYLRPKIEAKFFRKGQYCYLCGQPNGLTFDHFQPKTQVPQYALMPYNLIWCCSTCNGLKLNKRPVSELELFHPHFHSSYNQLDVLFEVVIESFVKNNANEIIFFLDVRAREALSPQSRNRVNRALRKLEIDIRLKEEIGSKLKSMCNVFKKHKRIGQSIAYISDRLGEAKDQKNYWDIISSDLLNDKNLLAEIRKLLR